MQLIRMNLSATSISLSSTVVLIRVTCCALHDGFACCLWQVPHGIDGYENAAAALSAEAAGVGKAANAISASHLRGTNSEEGLQGNAAAPSVLDMLEALSKISQGCFSREAASNSVCRSLDEFFTSLLFRKSCSKLLEVLIVWWKGRARRLPRAFFGHCEPWSSRAMRKRKSRKKCTTS